MRNTYVLPESHWNVTFLDKTDADIYYHESVCKLLDLLTVNINNKFHITDIPIGKITNVPSSKNPLKVAGENAIILDASPGCYWGQYAFQYAHELCHYLVDSKWPPMRDEWLEEVICECSSRYWLNWLSKSNFYPLSSDIFKNYAFQRTLHINSFNFKDLQNEDSQILTYFRENHEDRPHFNFLANQIMPIINDDPEIWSEMFLLRTISDNFTFMENLNNLVYQSFKHKKSFKRIVALFL
ncbi:hypothetical protein NMZ1139_00510 [Lactiplantibacillus plantarum]|uniref:hypothetical protein n=1 Tax=Lactiplantibacillus plantarum TaxID=1590 RepID=UPI0020890DC6|nr:hypothetical protein NMZ1139_00510 [Lactiplantibacillus plantarum]